MDTSKKVFGNKSFDSLMNDIYSNSTRKARTIDGIISKMTDMIGKEDGGKDNKYDSKLILPMIRDYLETAVRNDDHLIKLATLYQRIAIAEMKELGDDGFLSDSAIEQLKQEAKDWANDVKKETLEEPITEDDTTTEE